MDYKYIEQLLDRYWECQTTLEEEAILRSFFAQDDVPASLLPYKDIFTAEQEMAEETLGEDFDARMLEMIDHEPSVRAQKTHISFSLKPFYKASAVVAIILALGMAVQHGWRSDVPVASDNMALEPGDSTSSPELMGSETAGLTPEDSATIENIRMIK